MLYLTTFHVIHKSHFDGSEWFIPGKQEPQLIEPAQVLDHLRNWAIQHTRLVNAANELQARKIIIAQCILEFSEYYLVNNIDPQKTLGDLVN